ncbi:hypothetical protein Desmer_3292 [Desulfosporosinus meridiei DSM 13257]|uniref:Uncharacterized protein n=1 Tax=Desulfosporosinus meridiei (strain ATCC BAA-275 / DSM 13257 / KCTC 12902 / NCIMB 13706 / S10) TaxID=768704 RepID=J7J1G7_DESMD|nr:hypothetical protein Desmer_3292 [Desulfosporosinus meridiei DSM 13257]
MQRPASQALFTFVVFEAHLSNMSTAAGYFNANDFAVIMEINTVVINLTFVLIVHNFFTLSDILANPNITFDENGGNF